MSFGSSWVCIVSGVTNWSCGVFLYFQSYTLICWKDTIFASIYISYILNWSWRISGNAILQLFVPLQKNEIKKMIKKQVWVHVNLIENKYVVDPLINNQYICTIEKHWGANKYIKYTFSKQLFYKKN